MQHPQTEAEETDKPFLTRVVYSALNCLSLGSNSRQEASKRQMDWLRFVRNRPRTEITLRNDITMDEVRMHNRTGDAWIVFNQQVYDISSYLTFHPGGAALLLRYAGLNVTTAFMKQHPYVNIKSILSTCLVGSLVSSPIQEKAKEEILALRINRERDLASIEKNGASCNTEEKQVGSSLISEELHHHSEFWLDRYRVT